MTDNINLVIFLIYSSLYLIGYLTKGYFPVIAAGILLLGTTDTFNLFSSNIFNITFMLLIATGTIYHGIFLIMQDRKKDGRR